VKRGSSSQKKKKRRKLTEGKKECRCFPRKKGETAAGLFKEEAKGKGLAAAAAKKEKGNSFHYLLERGINCKKRGDRRVLMVGRREMLFPCLSKKSDSWAKKKRTEQSKKKGNQSGPGEKREKALFFYLRPRRGGGEGFQEEGRGEKEIVDPQGEEKD